MNVRSPDVRDRREESQEPEQSTPRVRARREPETTLGPGRKRDRDTRNPSIMPPVEDAADLASTLTTQMVSPDRRGASKRVCVRIVPTVDHLPLQVPPAVRRLSQPRINVTALFGHPKPRLSRSVPNDRDAIADDTSAERATVRVPVFACERGEKRERQSACVGLRNHGGIPYGRRHDRPRDARRRTAAVYIPEKCAGARGRVAVSVARASVEEYLLGDDSSVAGRSQRSGHRKFFSGHDGATGE